MKYISLHSVYLHNFKSFFSPTTIHFSQSHGLKFLGGSNRVESRLGSNGSGKSTLWDAMFWCLYGVGVRGQKAAELVTWGQTKPSVSVVLCIDGKLVEISRQGSPNRLTIDKEPSTQAEVDGLVRLTKDRFLQSVLFGQAVPLFLDLSVAGRGELLDGVLDLELWMRLSDAAGRQATSLGRLVADMERTLSFQQGKLAGIEDEKEVRLKCDTWQAAQDTKINQYIDVIEHTEKDIKDRKIEIAALKEELQELPNYIEVDEALQRAKEMRRQYRDRAESIDFYHNNKACPTCRQSLTSEFTFNYVEGLERDQKVINYDFLQEDIIELENLRSEAMTGQSKKLNQISGFESEIKALQGMIDMYTHNIELLDRESNPYQDRLVELKEVKRSIQKQIADTQNDLMKKKGELLKVEYWKQGFKKVRMFQMKQILMRLEIETANAANALGIGHWKIKYVTEVETKSGTTKSGVQVLISTSQHDGKWELCSGGEAQRIRLAVTLGLASFIQGMAGVFYDFEIFDEASQYLSVEGVEDLLTALSARAEMAKKSIFVVDHSALSFGGFTEIWSCVKTHEGSRLELQSQAN